ncbi:tripartite tricarboxylate transporter substrate binding protein [Roseomonas sp. KE2513]|uniref:Bug family tripartite tricarboxylate transporter substrate binding protein n=1 Tax=Roseomonas sp. KE2513 TaxID=2479202 RepID=UPI0018E01302|nr:tripartite tricarboxylate transporter substrate binding protein [Roseomonas sp. KE2513]MBI0534408.1 tripartite tricarboxylate transporter substrate binding protein [Roseomonas sp. KE2513]
MTERRILLAAATALATPRALRAQEAGAWPSRPIRFVVPFPPGGTTDIVARVYAQRMTRTLGQPMVVENRAGAGGTVGSDVVAKAPPDGYAFVMSNIASHAVGPNVYPRVPYDSVRDFTHIALLADVPSVLVVGETSPARDLAGFLVAARARPVTVASPGNGTTSHVLTTTLARLTGTQLVHVPYRGSAPGISDVMGGTVEAMITTLAEAGRNDRVRILAITSERRTPGWDAVPTFAELGLPQMTAPTWFGLSGPPGLPHVIADRMSAAAVEALSTETVRVRLADFGAVPPVHDRAWYAGYVAEELARWGKAVREAGVRAD